MPDVSVLTPSFGYGRFISDAILSVLAQNEIGIEHIVQDGASDDSTLPMLESFGDRILWKSEPDRGQSEALNRALEHASGDWVAWLNADEFYLPKGLTTLAALGELRGADVIYGDAVLVDEHGRLLRLLPQHGFNRHVLHWYGPFISSCATLFRTTAIGACPWDVRLRRVMDWDLYLRLADRGLRFVHVPWPVAAFRVHPAQVTALAGKDFASEYALIRGRHGNYSAGRARLGRVLHGLYKLGNRAYVRQYRARALRGLDFRWFDHMEGLRAADLLFTHCYPHPVLTTSHTQATGLDGSALCDS